MEDGKLTEQQKKKFEEHINKKMTLIGKCPVCSSRSWTVLDHMVHIPIHYGGNIMVGGPSYPSVGLICSNCGNTQLINAVFAGVVQANPSETNNGGGQDGGK